MNDVSVIIPVYNAEKYLHSCIEGLLSQTYAAQEIILVDDGSTDGSGDLCDQYIHDKSAIKVLHTANGGAAHARNVGLDHATGEFIVFIDADDKIPRNHLQVLIETQKKYNADMVSASITYVPGPTITHTDDVFTTWQFIEKVLYRDGASDYPVSKLYRRSMFDNMRFIEGITSEDFEIFYRLYQRATRIAITNRTTYYYIQRSSSVSNSGFSEKFFNRIDYCERLLQQVATDCSEILPAAQSRAVDEAIWLYGILPSHYIQQHRWIERTVKHYGEKVLKDVKASRKVKRKTWIYLNCPYVWKLRTRLKQCLIRWKNNEDSNANKV